jgi:hypothetical protein
MMNIGLPESPPAGLPSHLVKGVGLPVRPFLRSDVFSSFLSKS